jgi:hypothetical protein
MAARARSDSPVKPRSDLYTGLLVIAFLAQMVGVTFLAIDYMSYPSKAATPVSFVRPAPAGAGAAQP